jgi:polyisoprenoid-binding protein YceI
MKYFQLAIIAALLFTQCQNKTQDQSSSDEIVSIETVAYPDADTLTLDMSQSIITWVGSKPTGRHDGTIGLKEGFMITNENVVIGGKVIIDIPSLKIMNVRQKDKAYNDLYSHLMSNDFFDTIHFQTGIFEVTQVLPYDSTFKFESKKEFPSKYRPAPASLFTVSNPTSIVHGNLTLRGITHPIAFPATINYTSKFISIEAKFNIDRTAWDLSYDNEATIIDKARDKFIYNTVNVGFFISSEIKE